MPPRCRTRTAEHEKIRSDPEESRDAQRVAVLNPRRFFRDAFFV